MLSDTATTLKSLLPTAAITMTWAIMALPAMAAESHEKQARTACLEEIQEQFGAGYDKVDRRVQRGSSAYEFWVADRSGASDAKVYCKYSLRRNEIDTVVELAPGQFRP